MNNYKVILNTKFVGKTTTIIKARSDQEAIRKALAFRNEYNEIKAIIKLKREEV